MSMSSTDRARSAPAVIAAGVVALAPLALCGLVERRLAGALQNPLPAIGWLVLGALLAIWSVAAARMLPAWSWLPATAAWIQVQRWFSASIALLFLPTLWLSDTGVAGPLGFLLLLALAQISTVERRWPQPSLRSAFVRALDAWPSAATSHSTTRAQRAFVALRQPAPIQPVAAGPRVDTSADVEASFVRRRLPNGQLILTGFQRVDFEPGQRVAFAHVALCPPLDRLAQVDAEQMAGPSATVRAAQVLPFGIRFEIRLADVATAAGVVDFEFHIAEQADAPPPN